MADALARSGSDVVVWGTRPDKNDKAVEMLSAHGIRVMAQRVQVEQEEQVSEAMSELISRMGRLDTVIANAAVGGSGAVEFAELTSEEWRRILSVNEDGAFFTMREACKHMVSRARSGDVGGSLVGVASLAGLEGAARNQAYSAAKGAMMSMMRSIAVEYARYGIRANSIAPGWIATDMTRKAQESVSFRDKVISRVPMRRWGTPADFGGIAVYLASDASAYHTGDLFVIDGGYRIF